MAAPGLFFPTVALAAPILAAAGDDHLDALLAGDTTATVAVAGADGIWRANAEPVKTFVPEADRADWIVVVSRSGDGAPGARVVPRADARLRPVITADLLTGGCSRSMRQGEPRSR